MPYAELNEAGTRIDIESSYREKELLKSVPGTKWDPNARTWYAAPSWATCLQLRGVFGDALTVGPALGAWAKAEKARRVVPAMAARTAQDGPEVAGIPLYPHQRAGVAFMVASESCLNGDDMGVGKTVQTIATLEEWERADDDAAYPCLVVCPNAVKATWARDEFPRWAPARRVVEITGTASKRKAQLAAVANGEYDVAVINWEALKSFTRLAGYGNMTLSEAEKQPKELNEIAWRTVVADEAHRAKDPKAKQTRALWWLGDAATHRIALTGTPIADAPDDLFGPMRFVAPAEWAAKTRYVSRYCIEAWNMAGFRTIQGLKGETRDEFFGFFDPRYLRRTKAMVLPDLPPKVPVRRYAEMSPKQAKAYKAMQTAMVVELEGGILTATSPLTKLTRLMQFASAYGELGEPDADGKMALTLTAPSCKVDALLDVAEELGGQQAVVFAESKQLIKLAIAALAKDGRYTVVEITGDVTADAREESKRAFQEGRAQFVCCTMAAGGTGLTLTAAASVIFMQRSFNMISNLQSEDRVHRIGQAHDSVAIIDIVTPGTVDEAPHEVMALKMERLQEVSRDEAALAAWSGGGEAAFDREAVTSEAMLRRWLTGGTA